MKLSQRITGLTGGGSDGWDLFNKARRLIADGVPVTELTIGEHDIRTAAPILQEMHRAAMEGHTGYAAIPGTPELRDTIARRVSERTGIATTRHNVMITPGGQAALFAAHLAVCDPGDTALYIDPFYATYPGTIRGVSALPRTIKARAEDAFQPRAGDLAAAAPDARSLLINTPNKPTGVVYSRPRRMSMGLRRLTTSKTSADREFEELPPGALGRCAAPPRGRHARFHPGC